MSCRPAMRCSRRRDQPQPYSVRSRRVLSNLGFTFDRYIFSIINGTEAMTVGRTSASAGISAEAVGGRSRYTTLDPRAKGNIMPSVHS